MLATAEHPSLMGLSGRRRMRSVRATSLVLAVLAGMSSAAFASPFVSGDVFASVNNGQVKEFSPTGVLQQTLSSGSGYTTGSAFDAAGNFYVTMFSNNTVAKYNSNGVFQGNFGSGYSTPEAILIDGVGSVFVGSLNGPGLRKFDSSGALTASYAVGKRIDFFDLNQSETVMYYTDESGTIHRWDLATNTALANLCSSCGDFALRLLSDGTLLAAADGDVTRVNITTGAIVQTYDVTGVNGFFALNLDPDGTTFWTGSYANDNLYRFNIATGALVSSFNTGTAGFNLYGVSVFGEVCQAGCGGGTVPEPGTLALLGLGLAGFAALRRRRAH